MRWFRLPKHRNISGEKVVKVLCNTFGFTISGRSGSHVRLTRVDKGTKTGTIVPMYDELKPGTLYGILKLGKIDPEEFFRHL